jgi:hypothetical protein
MQLKIGEHIFTDFVQITEGMQIGFAKEPGFTVSLSTTQTFLQSIGKRFYNTFPENGFSFALRAKIVCCDFFKSLR